MYTTTALELIVVFFIFGVDEGLEGGFAWEGDFVTK